MQYGGLLSDTVYYSLNLKIFVLGQAPSLKLKNPDFEKKYPERNCRKKNCGGKFEGKKLPEKNFH